MPKQNNPRPRTYARNRVFSRKGHEKIYEYDSKYLLKLVIVILLGTFWLKFASPIYMGNFFVISAIPVGLIAGLIIVNRFEPLQQNRRIWYAVMSVITLVTYFLPAGIVI